MLTTLHGLYVVLMMLLQCLVQFAGRATRFDYPIMIMWVSLSLQENVARCLMYMSNGRRGE